MAQVVLIVPGKYICGVISKYYKVLPSAGGYT